MITEKIIRENALAHKKKKQGLSANRPSNDWAQKNSTINQDYLATSVNS